MSLEDNPANWVIAVNDIGNSNRSDAWEAIKTAGYDIHELVKNTEQLYATMQRANELSF